MNPSKEVLGPTHTYQAAFQLQLRYPSLVNKQCWNEVLCFYVSMLGYMYKC